jgi:hypothetical protein
MRGPSCDFAATGAASRGVRVSFDAGFHYSRGRLHIRNRPKKKGAGRTAAVSDPRKREQETGMSKSIKILAMFGFVTVVAACSQPAEEEYVVVEPEPISSEPVFTGKY